MGAIFRKTYRAFLAITVIAVLLSLNDGTSHATLIAVDLNIAGDKLLTRDTDARLGWLDLTATLGKSYNEAQAGFGGFITEGFRFATSSETLNLFETFGVTEIARGFYLKTSPAQSP